MTLPRRSDVSDGVDIQDLIVPVRRALVARYGVDVGSEAAADAAAWAVEHTQRLASMDNPCGYLYRVGQSAATKAVRRGRRHVRFPVEPATEDSPFDDETFRALAQLRDEHRTAVLLVHGHGFSYRQVADLLGVSEAAVTNFVHRGMTKLRSILKEDLT